MNLGELKLLYEKSLDAYYDKEEIRNFFNWVCQEYLGLKSFELTLRRTHELEERELENFHRVLNELKQQKPIQYILGKSYFYGLEFRVNEHTLIPRPETEELVDWILRDYKNSEDSIHILDIGSGSGCIPICLAKNIPNAQVYSIDISREALVVAQQNAIDNQVVVKFGEIDILKVSTLSNLFTEVECFDVIVSNPPYVRELEKPDMRDNVLKYEPEAALYVPDENPLLFYHQIASLAAVHLKDNGSLYFEINQYLGWQTKEVVLETGFKEVTLKQDRFGKDRMLKATLESR